MLTSLLPSVAGRPFLAQPNETAAFERPETWIIALIVAIVLFLFSILLLLIKRYKRCPSNMVLVVYGSFVGKGRSSKCIQGGATLVWPLFQDYGWLSLEPIQIEIDLRDALSHENIRVAVPSVFTVAIGTDEANMQNAAERLLGLPTREIQKQAEDILFGQLRQVIASMSIEDINRDRERFLENIQHSLEPELRKVGLKLINVNIRDITDNSGYIEAIGQKAAATAVQQARADVAEQEKLGETKVAEAKRDQDVNVAEATKHREIGVRQAERDQAVRIAEMNKEQAVAEERAVYERDAQVKEAEREKRVRVADFEAEAVKGENLAKAEIAQSRAELQVSEAEAYQQGETKEKEAEAAVLEAKHLAMARAAEADQKRVEAERRAELEAPAKAEKAKTIVEAEAVAERKRIEAEGEAKAIFAQYEAQARGDYEMLAQKGRGLGEIIEATGGADQAFRLMMLEHLDTLAETSAKAISNIAFDKIVVWEGGGTNGDTTATGNFLQKMARTLPPMMQVMRDIGGVEMPEYLVRMRDADAPSAEPGPAHTPVGDGSDAASATTSEVSEPPAKKSSGSGESKKSTKSNRTKKSN